MLSKLFLLLLVLSCNNTSIEKKTVEWETPEGGDFSLNTPSGTVNTADLRGKTLFIFFGFLQCPYICPTTIREMNQFMKLLKPDERKKVVPIFVTVDPSRDSLENLKERFPADSGIVAMTGTEEEIRKALGLFGGSFKVEEGVTPDAKMINHTSSVFVINRKGVWVNSLAYDAPAEQFRDALSMSRTQLPYWSDEAQASRIEILGKAEGCDLSKSPCPYTAPSGLVYEVAITPRPINHLKESVITFTTTDKVLEPKLADFVGIELPMGLIRPKLVKGTDGSWSAKFKLPTCELTSMTWKLRVLLQDSKKDNFEVDFGFTSYNDLGRPVKPMH